MIFVAGVAAGIGALLVGLWLGMQRARVVLWISLAVAVVSFAIYAICLNYSHANDGAWVLHDLGEAVAAGTIFGLYVVAGLSGPAFVTSRGWAIAASALAIVATLTVGTVAMLTLACAIAGDCI